MSHWAPLIGAVLGGVITNWLGDRRDRRRYAHEQTMAAQAQRHEQAMAVEARRQERLERTYHELLGYLKHHADWALAVRPLTGPVEVPPELTREEVRRVEALKAYRDAMVDAAEAIRERVRQELAGEA